MCEVGTLQICWMHRATQKSEDARWAFTNIQSDAPWVATIYRDAPWAIRPALACVDGFSLKMLSVDILHAYHLGCGRDMCGSCIKFLAARAGYWPGRNQEERLESATCRLRDYARNQRLHLTLRRLTKSNLNWDEIYPELRCKGV